MSCELLPCGHCKTALQDDHCGLPEHRYCAVCQSGDCYDGIDEQLHHFVTLKLKYEDALKEIQKVLLYAHDGGCVLPLRAIVDAALSPTPNSVKPEGK